jgi:hypothetical protein
LNAEIRILQTKLEALAQHTQIVEQEVGQIRSELRPGLESKTSSVEPSKDIVISSQEPEQLHQPLQTSSVQTPAMIESPSARVSAASAAVAAAAFAALEAASDPSSSRAPAEGQSFADRVKSEVAAQVTSQVTLLATELSAMEVELAKRAAQAAAETRTKDLKIAMMERQV